jgi:hypothetical protein
VERSSARPALEPVRGGLSPVYLLIPVLLGLFVGLGIGLKDRIGGGRVDRDQSYIALAATLYGQNPTSDVAADLRQRMISLGISNPSLTVLTLADDYSASRDPDLQHQADGLRLFGDALKGATGPLVNVPTAAATSLPTPTPLALLAATTPNPTPSPAQPTATPTSVLAALPPTDTATVTPTDDLTVSPTPELSPSPTARKATATPTRRATATPIGGTGKTINRNGIASTGTTKNVLVRKAPNTSAIVLVTIPNGSKVRVLKSVPGEVITKGYGTWYLVNWTSSTGKVVQGYIYGPLVKLTS